MANEGSTKPTYSELENELWQFRHLTYVRNFECREEALKSELARVRGLLKRASDALKAAKSRMPSRDSLPVRAATEAGRVLNVVDDSISELDSCLQGAESADIGKLDTVDEKACEHVAVECYTVNGVDEYNCSDCGAPIGVEMGKVNRVEEKVRVRRLADNIPPDFTKNDDLKDGYCAGVFDAVAELDKEKP